MIYDHYFHGENRTKGIMDSNRRMELGACHLCSHPDSEEHFAIECSGPPGTNTLEPIRTQVSHDITGYINLLRPGLGRTLAERYRDLALRPLPLTPQPQRVWKGLLSAKQWSVLLDTTGLTENTPDSTSVVKTIKAIQNILAIGFTDIRTQITAHTYPNKHFRSPCDTITAAQQMVIGERSTQPSIRTHFSSSSSPNDLQGASAPRQFCRLAHRGNTKPLRPTFSCGSGTTSIFPQYVSNRATNALPTMALSPPRLGTHDLPLPNPPKVILHPTLRPTGLYHFDVQAAHGFTLPEMTLSTHDISPPQESSLTTHTRHADEAAHTHCVRSHDSLSLLHGPMPPSSSTATIPTNFVSTTVLPPSTPSGHRLAGVLTPQGYYFPHTDISTLDTLPAASALPEPPDILRTHYAGVTAHGPSSSGYRIAPAPLDGTLDGD
jgi:hypothetical protein